MLEKLSVPEASAGRGAFLMDGYYGAREGWLAAYEQNRNGSIFLEIETTPCAHRGGLGTQAKQEGKGERNPSPAEGGTS